MLFNLLQKTLIYELYTNDSEDRKNIFFLVLLISLQPSKQVALTRIHAVYTQTN